MLFELKCSLGACVHVTPVGLCILFSQQRPRQSSFVAHIHVSVYCKLEKNLEDMESTKQTINTANPVTKHPSQQLEWTEYLITKHMNMTFFFFYTQRTQNCMEKVILHTWKRHGKHQTDKKILLIWSRNCINQTKWKNRAEAISTCCAQPPVRHIKLCYTPFYPSFITIIQRKVILNTFLDKYNLL